MQAPGAIRAGAAATVAVVLVGSSGLMGSPAARGQTPAELRGYQQRVEQLFERLDQNGDQRLQRHEVDGHPYLQKHFSRLDAHQRGYLRPEDLRPTAPASATGSDRTQRFLQRADHNGDGVLDRQEAAAFPWLQRRFRDADRNGDGLIGGDELRRLRTGGSNASGNNSR